jgi:hypothetical protein
VYNTGGNSILGARARSVAGRYRTQRVVLAPQAWFVSAAGSPDGSHDLWAPAVFSFGGRHVAYFSARNPRRGERCVGIARASGPLAGFRVVAGTRPICAPRPARDRGVSAEAVDPSYYRNRSGQHFLLFKGSVGRPAHVAIWAYRMKKDAVTVASRSPHVVLRARAPGLGNTIENPQLVRHGGSSTCSARSTTGAAAATAPTSTPLVPTAASTGIRRRSIC